MGKFSKAIEKAEKEHSVKPHQRSIVESEGFIAETEAYSPNGQQPCVNPNDQHQHMNPVDTKPSNRPKQPTPIDASSSIVEVVKPPIEPNPNQEFINRSELKHQHSKVELAVPPGKPRSSVKEEEEINAKSEANVPLIKPELPEKRITPQYVTREPGVRERVVEGPENRITELRRDVTVSYSRTKVQANDPSKLKNNNVLSVFENFETTNEFKILRTQVLRKLKAIGGNSILVTSANPYEGKTFTSINLGVSIAKEFDRTVLIIDADVRRPTQQHTDFSTEFFSLDVEKGLTDYLVGDADIEDVLINPGIDKLTLIPGGLPVDNSPELLNSARMEKMMMEIKSRYPSDRLVIVDGPALLHFPDAMILYRYVDGVLPVVEAERTPTDDLVKMMAQLKEVNVLGVVLNKNRG